MPPIFLVALVLLALIWGFAFLRKCGLLGGLMATLVVGCCFGHAFFHVSAFTVDRALVALLLVMYLAARWLYGLPAKKFAALDVAVITLMLIVSLSTFTHAWSIDDAQPVATLLFFYLLPAVLYWIAARSPLSEQASVRLWWALLLFSIYLAITAVFEVLGLSALIFPRYIVTSEVEEFLGRGRGPLLNPVGNGLYLTAGLLSVCMLWFHVRASARWPLGFAAGVIAVGLGCTLTRSVWLGAAVALLVALVMWAPRQHRLRVLLAAGIAGSCFLVVTGSSLVAFKRDKHVSAEQMAESAKLRPVLAAYAFEIFRAHPWQGVGFGQYRHANREYLTARSFDVPMGKGKDYVQHNVFLSLLTETGVFGLGALLFLLGAWAVASWKVWHRVTAPLWQRQWGMFAAAFLAAYVVNGMFHETSLIPMVNALVLVLAGLLRNPQRAPVPRGVRGDTRAGDVRAVPTSGWSLG